jgi:outer membrane usher protein
MYTHKRSPPLPVVLVTVLLMFLGSTSVAAAEKDRLAILEWTLNEVHHGDVVVVIRDRDLLIHVDALHAAGVVDVHGRVEKISGKRFVSLSSITPKLDFSFNEDAQTLKVTAKPELFEATIIDLGPGKPNQIEHRTDASAFLNYSWTLENFEKSSGFAEGGLSLNGVLLSSTVFASMQSGFVRGLSNLTYDNRKHLVRVTLGDTFVSSGELGSGQFIGGIGISKNFTIDPYYVRVPSMGYNGTALTPSNLDIWVNGTRVRTMPIAPGPFQTQNLPVMAGTGNVRYVLRDAFGQEHAVDTRYSVVSNQLKKGTSEYTYGLGFRRVNMGVESFDYQQLMGLGMHRVGVTDRVTVGLRLEANAEMASGGLSAQFTLPFGHASVAIAASGGSESLGIAGVARIGYWSRKFIAMAMVQGTSAQYTTASLAANDDRNLLEARFTASIAPWRRVSLSADTMLAVPRDLPLYFRFGTSLNLTLRQGLQFLVNAHGVRSRDEQGGAEISGMLTYAFDKGFVASAGARTTASTPEAFAAVSRPLMQFVDSGFRASGVLGDHPRGELAVESQGTQGRFMATLTGDQQTGPRTTFQASGAIVALKGAGVFLTRPVYNGFAVLEVPKVRGVRGYLENQEVGQTDENGYLVLPNVLSYYGSRIRMTGEDLPLDMQVDDHERIISPPLRGGALVQFSVKRMRLYRGFARIEKAGAQIIPSYGEIQVSRGKDVVTSPLGKEGEFELPDLTVGDYQAKIIYGEGTCSFDFTAKESSSVVTDVGTIVCVSRKEEK